MVFEFEVENFVGFGSMVGFDLVEIILVILLVIELVGKC